MKQLILKVSIFILISLVLFVCVLYQANGYTDPYYLRFTTPVQNSLILGTSKAAQSLQPEVFKDELNLEIYNYAFTIMHSPYGPVYLEAIKRKLKPETDNGIFILTVDAWSITSTKSEANQIGDFRENNLCLDNTTIVNKTPNLQYLLKNLKGEFYQIILRNLGGKFYNTFSMNKPILLHKDGWLEITANMDSVILQERTELAIKNFKENDLPNFRYSSIRLDYFIETIKFLKEHGEVYLVRLPIHNEMMKVEDLLIPDFNEKMNEIAILSDGYFDMTPYNNEFIYVDGAHLFKDSGKIVSKSIADWIKNRQGDK